VHGALQLSEGGFMGYSTCGERDCRHRGGRARQSCDVCDTCPECAGRKRQRHYCRVCCGPLVSCSPECAAVIRAHIAKAREQQEQRERGAA